MAVLEEGAKYSYTTPEPEKTQLLESRRYQVLDTIRAWRVPPHKAGDYSQAHLANIEDHHPDLHLTGYRNVALELSTHAVGGLTENDFILAAKIDLLSVELKK